MIVINKHSKIYKTYNFLSKIFFFSNVTPIQKGYNYGEIDTFRDVCTFLRTTLLYLFFSFPLFVSFFLVTFYVLYSLVLSVVTLTLSPTTILSLSVIAAFSIIGIIIGLVFLIITLIERTSKLRLSQTSFIILTTEAIKSKHNKFCQVLKVVDQPVLKTNDNIIKEEKDDSTSNSR